MPRPGWLAVGALLCGLAFGVLLPAPRPLLAVTLVAACATVVALVVARRPSAAAVAFGTAVMAARLLAGDLTGAPAAPPPDVPLDGTWTAQVLTLGSTTGGEQRSVLVIRAADTAIAGPAVSGPWRAYAWLPRYPPLIPGDRITFEASLEPVLHDGSEFAGYLASIEAAVTVRVRELDLVASDGGVLEVAESVRRLADESLARVVPEPMAGLASAILVGRRDRVSREVTDAFTATGLSHVVAISGWNIALIGAVIGSLLAAAGMGRRRRTIAIVVALGMFTLVAGGGASVVRAALMGGVVLAARETGRPGSAAAALGLATFGLLLLDPAMATDIGFQLSVAATAGLLVWGGRISERLMGPRPGAARRWLADSLGVSLAAQAATLPLVLFHFGRLSLVSPVANLVVAPIVAPAMLVASLCLLAGLVVGLGVPALVAAPFAVLGWVVLGAMVAVAGTFGGLPFASVELPAVVATMGAAGLALAVLAIAWRSPTTSRPAGPPEVAPGARSQAPSGHHRKVIAVAAGLVAVVVGSGLLLRVVHREARLVVTALDVGQGDAILVEGPRGGRLLLDGGPDPDRLLMVLDRHVPPWDRRIDLVVLTHPHEDHVAGLAVLLARYRVGGIAENGMIGAGPGDVAFRERLATMGIAAGRLAAGDRLSFDGVRAEVLWPIAAEVPATAPSDGRRVNDTSVVLDLRFGERRILLTGDIEDDVDPRLLSMGIAGHESPLDVLKVAHHGSGSATSEAWLDALRPRVAMISSGTGNRYGHPAPRTLDRLDGRGARVLRTDLDGDLEVSTDGHDLRVATSGGRIAVAPPPTAPRALSIAQGLVLCAIPISPAQLAARDPSPPARPAQGRPMGDEGPPAGPRRPVRGDPLTACYDRTDDHPDTARRGRTATLAPTGGRDPRALDGDRGRRVVPRGGRGSRGPPGRSGARRERGPAA